MSNTQSTLIRIIMIFMTLLSLWFVLSIGINIILSTLSLVEFSITNSSIILMIVLLFRAFYPKNVFI